MSTIFIDLQRLYQQQFGTRPFIGEMPPAGVNESFEIRKQVKNEYTEQYILPEKNTQKNASKRGSLLISKDSAGIEIWLPVWLENLPKDIGDNGSLYLPYTVVRISGSSSVIRTPMLERRGTVKELYSIDDYKISIKGFFIDKEQRLWPEDDLVNLRKVHEQGKAFTIRNALTDVFLYDPEADDNEQQRVIITAFDLPEVEGGRRHVRPFSMQLESDSVFTLELE